MSGRTQPHRTSHIYRLAPEVKVLFFDDEAVVFNPKSWETHVLNASASLILERLLAGACGKAEVEQILLVALDQDERKHAREHAERLLGDLVSLHLIAEMIFSPDEADRPEPIRN